MLAAGTPAPSFAIKNHQDQVIKLEDFRGYRVLLWFFPKADPRD
jgi:peroxiredoxin